MDHDTQSAPISADARAIIDALNNGWMARGFNLGIGLTGWALCLAAFGFIVVSFLREGVSH